MGWAAAPGELRGTTAEEIECLRSSYKGSDNDRSLVVGIACSNSIAFGDGCGSGSSVCHGGACGANGGCSHCGERGDPSGGDDSVSISNSRLVSWLLVIAGWLFMVVAIVVAGIGSGVSVRASVGVSVSDSVLVGVGACVGASVAINA